MSNGERIRTLIFAVLFTIASVIMIIGIVTTGETDAVIGLCMFVAIALFDWLKLLVNS